MDSAASRRRLVYRTDQAAGVLGVKPASLRSLAKRRATVGAPVAWGRGHPANPTDSYLFPVEYIDGRARQEALDRGRPAPDTGAVARLDLELPDLAREQWEDVPRPSPLVDPELELALVKGEARVERDRREELEVEHSRQRLEDLGRRTRELEADNERLRADLNLAHMKVEQLAELLRADAAGRRSAS